MLNYKSNTIYKVEKKEDIMKKIIFLMLFSLLLSISNGFTKDCNIDTTPQMNVKKLIKKLKKDGMSDAGLKVLEKEYTTTFNDEYVKSNNGELQKLHLEFQGLFLSDKVDNVKLKAVNDKITAHKKAKIDKHEQLMLNLATNLTRKDREVFIDSLKMRCSDKDIKKKK